MKPLNRQRQKTANKSNLSSSASDRRYKTGRKVIVRATSLHTHTAQEQNRKYLQIYPSYKEEVPNE